MSFVLVSLYGNSILKHHGNLQGKPVFSSLKIRGPQKSVFFLNAVRFAGSPGSYFTDKGKILMGKTCADKFSMTENGRGYAVDYERKKEKVRQKIRRTANICIDRISLHAKQKMKGTDMTEREEPILNQGYVVLTAQDLHAGGKAVLNGYRKTDVE